MDALIGTAGLSYFAAVATLFVAALIAKAGAPRAPNEEPARRGVLMNLLALASALTPALLAFYGYAVAADMSQRIVLMTLPIAAGFLGSLVGALIGLITRDARIMFRMASIVAGFGALILAVGVTAPRLDLAWLMSTAEALTH
jgi:hypothetical protein